MNYDDGSRGVVLPLSLSLFTRGTTPAGSTTQGVLTAQCNVFRETKYYISNVMSHKVLIYTYFKRCSNKQGELQLI